MDKVTIAFSRRTDGAIGGKLIAASENRNFSHVLVIFQLEGTDVVFQASHGMVNMISLEKFLEKNIITISYDYFISTEMFSKVKKSSIAMLGIPYGVIQLVYICIMKILNIKRWPIRIYKLIKNGDKQEICSELVSSIVMLIDPAVDFAGMQLDFITPSDLESKLEAQGSWKWREDGQT